MKSRKINWARRTKIRNIRVTLWKHPEYENSVVFEGCPAVTKPKAAEFLYRKDFDAGLLKGTEEYWSRKQLKELPEFDG